MKKNEKPVTFDKDTKPEDLITKYEDLPGTNQTPFTPLRESWSRTSVKPGLKFRLMFLISTKVEMEYRGKINEHREIDSAEVDFHIQTPWDNLVAFVRGLFSKNRGAEMPLSTDYDGKA